MKKQKKPKQQVVPTPIRKVIIWSILLIICIPNVLFAPMNGKIAAVVLAILLVWWDNVISKKDTKSN